MPEENKNQNRDLSQIRLELITLLKYKKKLEEIKLMQAMQAQAMNNEKTSTLNQGRQKKLETLYDRLPVFLIAFGLATSSFFAIWLNSLL